MPSNAFTTNLNAVLADATEVDTAHRRLRTGNRGRQYGLGALNRAIVVMSISAWEAYVEEVVKELLPILRPATPPLGTWPALNASVRSAVGRFNNPNSQHVRDIFRDSFGLQDITTAWTWQNTTQQQNIDRLDEAIQFRHETAHGTVPRPVIANLYARRLPGFFRNLGTHTDQGLTDFLNVTYGLPTGW